MLSKDFLSGVKFALGLLCIFSFLGVIYAVGFHNAAEIGAGTFQSGNFIFDGIINTSSSGDFCITGGTCLSNIGEITCPENFTLISNNSRTLGCIQNTRESTGDSCTNAILGCWDTYSAKLPSYSELRIASLRYAANLTDELVGNEWVDVAMYYGAGGQSCGSMTSSGTPSASTYTTTSYGYRCWIPATGGGGGGSSSGGGSANLPTCSEGQSLTYTNGDWECSYRTTSSNSDWELIELKTASSSPSLNFTTGISDQYSAYEVRIIDIVPGTDSANFHLRVSTDGGSTWESGASDYAYVYDARYAGASGSSEQESTASTYIRLCNGVGSDPGETISGRLGFYAPSQSDTFQSFEFNLLSDNGVNTLGFCGGAGSYLAQEAINGVQFFMDLGNIESGEIALYGLRTTSETTTSIDFTCPANFTKMENQGRFIGCVQNSLEGNSVTCKTAINGCYDNYGGRLPTYSEIFLATTRYNSSLTDEDTQVEWTDEGHYTASLESCGVIHTTDSDPSSYPHTSTTPSYRCFIPPNSAELSILCPSGFTKIEKHGVVLGCIQTQRAGDNIAWDDALDACWSTYGARLPTGSEWQIAAENFAIDNTSVSGHYEFLNEIIYNGNNYHACIYLDGGTDFQSSCADAANPLYQYRCFIPSGLGGSGTYVPECDDNQYLQYNATRGGWSCIDNAVLGSKIFITCTNEQSDNDTTSDISACVEATTTNGGGTGNYRVMSCLSATNYPSSGAQMYWTGTKWQWKNDDGTYNDCQDGTVQIVNLNAISGGNVNSCPANFTKIEKSGNFLGCMQTIEANGGTGLDWYDASDYCFDNYGGRLPFHQEWYIAMENYDLTDEIDTHEWVADNDNSGGTSLDSLTVGRDGTASTGLKYDHTSNRDTGSNEFRCFIPSGSLSVEDTSCPDGFTQLESQGEVMGCMQNTEEGTGTCLAAIDDCFTTYGGRTPSYAEIYAAFTNYALTDENDDKEWLENGYEDSGVYKCGVFRDTGSLPGGELQSGTHTYRCFIPR